MNVRIFRNSPPSAAARREHRPARAEPRLFPGGESRSPTAAAVDGPRLVVAESEPSTPMTPPTIRAPGDRLVAAAGGAGAGTALQVALVGVVAAAIIGAFLGVGFLLLARPVEQTVAAAQLGSAPSPAPTSPKTAMPHPAAAALPAASVANRAPSTQAAPVSQIPPANHAPSPSPISKSVDHAAAALASGTSPPIAAVTATKTAVGGPSELPAAASDHRAHRPPAALSDHRSHRPPTALSDRGAQPPPAAGSDHRAQRPAAAASNHAALRPPVHDRPFARTRTASRHPHLRPPADDRPPAPRHASTARLSAPPQDGGTQSFGQLLSQLTGGAQHQGPGQMQPAPRPRPAEQVLTPPAADQPDPFAAGGSQRYPATQ